MNEQGGRFIVYCQHCQGKENCVPLVSGEEALLRLEVTWTYHSTIAIGTVRKGNVMKNCGRCTFRSRAHVECEAGARM